MIIGFSQPVYTIEEDNMDGTVGMSLTIQIFMVSNIEFGREFTFSVSAVGLTATGNQLNCTL